MSCTRYGRLQTGDLEKRSSPATYTFSLGINNAIGNAQFKSRNGSPDMSRSGVCRTAYTANKTGFIWFESVMFSFAQPVTGTRDQVGGYLVVIMQSPVETINQQVTVAI
ncbi:hypothetical protein ElyMa_005520600 [Elysia marginata]|uniref:Uncharacterized protein n=1 Tax=Elysia marginata TaxID=1093978 RepID=A0AAV4EWF5_9GAST|nr:hypothetical protein ElyMa_005520600 [Elysia marginata]